MIDPAVRAVLVAARALLSDPARWCRTLRGWPARDDGGHPIASAWPGAREWTLLGALERAATPAGDALANPDWGILGPACDACLTDTEPGTPRGRGLERYNDTHTHAEVLALLDRALGEAS